MNFDTLKQLTLVITIISVIFLTLSYIRNRQLSRYILRNLKKDFGKKYIKYYLSLFIIFLAAALPFAFSYISLDIANKISDHEKNSYLGNFNYVYREYSAAKDINDVINVQKDEIKKSESLKGIYSDVSVYSGKDMKYFPNTAYLAFDNINLNENQFISFGDNLNTDTISINGTILSKKDDFDNSKLNGLDKFRGWSITELKSHDLIITNTETAKKILKLSGENLVFTNKSFDLSTATLTKNLSDKDKSLYFQTVSEITKEGYKNSIFNTINPFNILLIFSLGIYLILIFPLYRKIKQLSKLQRDNFEFLLSTGANSGIVTKYLTFYFFIPFVILVLFSTLISVAISFALYRFIDLSYVFGNFNISSFYMDPTTPIFIFTNLFALFFLVIFFLFYSSYTPSSSFRYSKFNMFKLTSALVLIFFGVSILIFSKDIPEEAKGLIPFLFVCGPIISLLGSLILFKLKPKFRYIVLLISGVIYIAGFIILIITNNINKTPSGLIILALIGIFIIALTINEWSYKDFPKLITAGVSTLVSVFLIVLSSTGINTSLNNQNSKYNFDLSIQTYTLPDKSINTDMLFPNSDIVNKVSLARTQLISLNNDESGTSLTSLDLVTVPKNALSAKNLSDQEKDNFYKSTDEVIMSAEYKNNQQIKENDVIVLKDLSSGKIVTRKIFKILDDDGGNSDIYNKIIFPDLDKALKDAHSSINSIYLLKTSSKEEKDNIKTVLSENNIYDYIDLDERAKVSIQNSKTIIQNILVLVVILNILMLIFTITKNVLKGFINFFLIFGFSIFISLYYQSQFMAVNLSSDIKISLIILILSVIILYGTNFTLRKLKNR